MPYHIMLKIGTYYIKISFILKKQGRVFCSVTFKVQRGKNSDNVFGWIFITHVQLTKLMASKLVNVWGCRMFLCWCRVRSSLKNRNCYIMRIIAAVAATEAVYFSRRTTLRIELTK